MLEIVYRRFYVESLGTTFRLIFGHVFFKANISINDDKVKFILEMPPSTMKTIPSVLVVCCVLPTIH